MKRLSARGQKWLKGFHLFFACLWVGGAVGATLMIFCMKPTYGMQLHGINQSINFIDFFVIIPGNCGILLTGLIYSSLTSWGWFRHKWIIVKWAIGIYGMVFGIIWLGPWASNLEHISKAKGISALSNPAYLHNQRMLYWWGSFQVATIIFAIFISALRPWKSKKT